jgi:hypothetical protein
MSPPEVHLDLLKLLKALGYLEGARWQDTRDPQRTVQVVSLEGAKVTYGNPGDVHHTSTQEFLKWFSIQMKTPSVIKDGAIESESTSLKSSGP